MLWVAISLGSAQNTAMPAVTVVHGQTSLMPGHLRRATGGDLDFKRERREGRGGEGAGGVGVVGWSLYVYVE